MKLRIRCPNCGKHHAAPDSWLGRMARCGACLHRFLVGPEGSQVGGGCRDQVETVVLATVVDEQHSTSLATANVPARVTVSPSIESRIVSDRDSLRHKSNQHAASEHDVPQQGRTSCPHCLGSVGLVSKLTWKQVTCPHCLGSFLMPGKMNWLDRQLAHASGCSIIALIIISGTLPLILGLVALVVCRHPEARKKAEDLALGGAIVAVLGIMAWVFMFLAASAGNG